MTFSESTLHKYIEEKVKGIRQSGQIWQNGEVSPDAMTNITYSTARNYERLAHAAALLGATRQSRQWIRESARFYLERIRAGRQLRDIREQAVWKAEIATFARAIRTSLLSRDEELLSEVATEALEMDKCYLDVFASENRDYTAKYYIVKLQAALILTDERIPQLLENYREGVENLDGEGSYWEVMLSYYQALVDESEAGAETAILEQYEYFSNVLSNPDDPSEYIFSRICSSILLARRRGLELEIPESDRLPNALLREDIPEDDVELDVDLEDVEIGSDVGLFELERDDDGTPVIAGRIYHPGDEPVSADDVPDREAGRVLSDEWVEAALEEATWRDHYDDELVDEAKSAFDDGSLIRRLVVVQDRVGPHTFDDSLTELPVDDFQQLKGAGRH